MKPIHKLFREINFTFINLILFSSFMNGLIIFLLSYLALSILRISWLYALIPSIIYCIISVYTHLNMKPVREIEQKFPFLDEELRTAADNMNMENPVFRELQDDIFEKIKKVDVGSFFDSGKTSMKVLISIILCFSLLLVATSNMTFDFKVMVNNMPNYIYVGGGNASNGNGSQDQGNVRVAGTGTSTDILGDQQVAQLGDEKVNVVLTQGGYDINLQDVVQPQKRYFQELYPTDVCNDKSCRQAQSYDDQLTKDQSDIVKNYFSKIAS